MYFVVLRTPGDVVGHARDLVAVVAPIGMYIDREVLALIGFPAELNFDPIVAEFSFTGWIVSISL